MKAPNYIIERRKIIFYFQVHQPRRLKTFRLEDNGIAYFDDHLNETILSRVAKDAYIPANKMILNLLGEYPEVKVCYSITGETLDQFNRFAPEVMEGFQALAKTNSVEFFGETYHHSLSSLFSEEEFQTQVIQHKECLQKYFNAVPTVFRNTELIYNDGIGRLAAKFGFKGIICEGENVPSITNFNKIFQHPDARLKLIFRNPELSNKILLRFAEGKSTSSVDHFIESISALSDSSVTLIGLNYEHLIANFNKGEDIITFLRDLLLRLIKDERFLICNASDAIDTSHEDERASVIEPVSWSNDSKDISPWLGNDMQQEALDLLTYQEKKLNGLSDEFKDSWRSLQCSDHFYNMSTIDRSGLNYIDGQYPSAYEAFINYMNVLKHLVSKFDTAVSLDPEDHAKALEYERQHPKTPLWAIHQETQYKLAKDSHL